MAGLSDPAPAAAGALAWCLGAVDLLLALGWLALAAFASRFRVSFGAGQVGAGLAIVPALAFGLLAVAAWLPAVALLRLVAVGLALLLAVGALPLLAKAPYLAIGALLHAAAWGWLAALPAGG